MVKSLVLQVAPKISLFIHVPQKIWGKFKQVHMTHPHMEVLFVVSSSSWGSPNWLVYNGQSYLEMDDDWGYPYDLGNLHITQTFLGEQCSTPLFVDDYRGLYYAIYSMG